MGVGDYLYRQFLSNLQFAPTECQDRLFRMLSGYIAGYDNDIFVVNGYAGTGKTTAVVSIVRTLKSHGRAFRLLQRQQPDERGHCELLRPLHGGKRVQGTGERLPRGAHRRQRERGQSCLRRLLLQRIRL